MSHVTARKARPGNPLTVLIYDIFSRIYSRLLCIGSAITSSGSTFTDRFMGTDVRGDGIGGRRLLWRACRPENGGTLAGALRLPGSIRAGDRLPVGPGIAVQLRGLAADLGASCRARPGAGAIGRRHVRPPSPGDLLPERCLRAGRESQSSVKPHPSRP